MSMPFCLPGFQLPDRNFQFRHARRPAVWPTRRPHPRSSAGGRVASRKPALEAPAVGPLGWRGVCFLAALLAQRMTRQRTPRSTGLSGRHLASPGRVWDGLLALATAWTLGGAEVRISELLPEDNGVLADEDGDYRGWVELYNPGPDVALLENYGLSNDPGQPFKWRFPALGLQPDERLVVFTSGKNRRELPVPPETEPLWTPDRLSGLLLWLDAAATDTLEVEGDGVVRWWDRTGRPYAPPSYAPRAPETVPGLVLWLDADDLTTLVREADNPLSWQDKSGLRLEAKAPNAAASPTVVTAEDGRHYLRFDGVDDHLALPRVDQARTVF